MGRPTMVARLIAVAIGAIYSGALLLSGVSLAPPIAKALSFLPLLVAAVLWLWDAWLWRVPILHAALHRPRIDGLWRVTYTPTANSRIPEGGSRGPIPGYVVIRQTFWSISICSFTAQSASDSKAFFWERQNGETESLTYTYENRPRESEIDRSIRHFGTTCLRPTTRIPRFLHGMYFTDRYTKGDIDAELLDRRTGFGSFAEADAFAIERARVR